MKAESSRCCGFSSGARAWNARSCGGADLISRSGGTSPVAVASPKRQAFRLSTGFPLDGRRAAGVGTRADHFFRQRQVDPADPAIAARVVDLRRGAFRLARPATSTSPGPAAERRGSYLRIAVLDGAQGRRVGAGKRALDRDLGHLGREAVGIDPGDQHPRRIGLAHAQQQPGPLGGPVDRIDTGRRAGAASSASRSAICAQREAIGVSPSAASESRGTRRSPRPTARRQARLARIEAPTTHGSRRAQPGYSTGGGGAESGGGNHLDRAFVARATGRGRGGG